MIRIAHARADEGGRYSGGAAGDQTGGEVTITAWYNRPWTTIMRPKNAIVGAAIASVAEQIAASPHVGYDQVERLTLWEECERIQWNIAMLPLIHDCECDCSSLIAVICRFVGIEIPRNVWTGTLPYYLQASGNFYSISGAALSDPEQLLRGDILINDKHHAAVVLDTGIYASVPVNYYAYVNVSDYLQVRISPKVADNEMFSGGQSFRLPPGMMVHIVEECNGWGRIDRTSGWVYLGYLEGRNEI